MRLLRAASLRRSVHSVYSAHTFCCVGRGEEIEGKVSGEIMKEAYTTGAAHAEGGSKLCVNLSNCSRLVFGL